MVEWTHFDGFGFTFSLITFSSLKNILKCVLVAGGVTPFFVENIYWWFVSRIKKICPSGSPGSSGFSKM